MKNNTKKIIKTAITILLIIFIINSLWKSLFGINEGLTQSMTIVAGTQGPTGGQGPTGEQGPPGAAGASGSIGAAGADGAHGYVPIGFDLSSDPPITEWDDALCANGANPTHPACATFEIVDAGGMAAAGGMVAYGGPGNTPIGNNPRVLTLDECNVAITSGKAADALSLVPNFNELPADWINSAAATTGPGEGAEAIGYAPGCQIKIGTGHSDDGVWTYNTKNTLSGGQCSSNFANCLIKALPTVPLVLTLTDAYGDGWNGCQLYIENAQDDEPTEGTGPSGVEISPYQLLAGSEKVITLNLVPGEYKYYMYVGAWAGETSWQLENANSGVILAEQEVSYLTPPSAFPMHSTTGSTDFTVSLE